MSNSNDDDDGGLFDSDAEEERVDNVNNKSLEEEAAEEEEERAGTPIEIDDEDDNNKGPSNVKERKSRGDVEEVELQELGSEEEEEEALTDSDGSDGSDDEEDEDEEEKEDDEEQEEGGKKEKPTSKKRKASGDKNIKKKKKARSSVRNFFDEEAEVGDEEDEDDFDAEEGALAARYEQELRNKQKEGGEKNKDTERRGRVDLDEIDRRKVHEEANRDAALIKERYKNQKVYSSRDDANYSEGARALPDHSDPKLYAVKVKTGSEESLVIQIMNKFAHSLNSKEPMPMPIYSASYTGVKGFIYIEAQSDASIRTALNGIRDVYLGVPKKGNKKGMLRVPITEMTSVFTIKNRKAVLKAGQYVRFVRGDYKGDLAVIDTLCGDGQKIIVKVVPRIPPEGSTKKTGSRPPSKLFYPDERESERKVWNKRDERDSMSLYKNNWYMDGFLYKECSMAMVTGEIAKPDLQEMQHFKNSKTGDENAFLAPTNKITDKKKVKNIASRFREGDRVVVCSGELTNLPGIVESVNEISQEIKIRGSTKGFRDIVTVHASELKKLLAVGDHVKVVSGRYSGETGSVQTTSESEDGKTIAVLITDVGNKELTVLVDDLITSKEVARGLDSLGGYELFDLVTLGNDNDVGVIVEVGREEFKVLEQNDEITLVSLANIKGKRNQTSSKAACLDSKNNQINVNDMVSVLSGKWSSRSGTIKHINRSNLFLHNPLYIVNNGLFAVNAKHVSLHGSKPATSSSVLGTSKNETLQSPSHFKEDRVSLSGLELIGKTVSIRHGRYKGMMGVVRNAVNKDLRVELHARHETVSIDRNSVVLSKSYGEFGSSGFGSYNDAATPLHGSQTPLYGAMTPMHGSMTPMHGSMTPSRYDQAPGTPGGGADAWNAAIPNTPAHNTDYNNDLPYVVATPSVDLNHTGSVTPLGSVTPRDAGYGGFRGGGSYTPLQHGTPGIPGTPGNDGSYTPSGSVHTPGYGGFSGGSYTPLGAPATPGASTPLYSDDYSSEQIVYRAGVLVTITSGHYRDMEGTVEKDSSVNMVSVIIDAANRPIIKMNTRDVKLIIPKKSDKVKILIGDNAGASGTFLTPNGAEAVVKLDDGNVVVYPLSHIGKIN